MTEEDKLYESILTTQVILCMRCREKGVLHEIGDYEAAEKFQEIGWSAKGDGIYCPDCSKKKL